MLRDKQLSAHRYFERYVNLARGKFALDRWPVGSACRYAHNHDMLKRLSNLSEQRVHDEIVGAAEEYDAHIYRKVRIADAINIDHLGMRGMGTYALQAHFDFCVSDANHLPAFAIEFDGAGHEGLGDAKKNKIARAANLALFRVDERLLGRSLGGVTFLQYLIHTYFLSQAFREWQESGQLDPSEPFIMGSFLKPDAKNIFDSQFNFDGAPRSRINRMLSKAGVPGGPLHHLGISAIMLGRDQSSFVGFASVRVGERTAFSKARIDVGTPSLGHLGEVPFGWSALSDFCEGMVIENLCDEIELMLAGDYHVVRTWEAVEADINDLRSAGYAPLRGSSGGRCDPRLARYIFPTKSDS